MEQVRPTETYAASGPVAPIPKELVLSDGSRLLLESGMLPARARRLGGGPTAATRPPGSGQRARGVRAGRRGVLRLRRRAEPGPRPSGCGPIAEWCRARRPGASRAGSAAATV